MTKQSSLRTGSLAAGPVVLALIAGTTLTIAQTSQVPLLREVADSRPWKMTIVSENRTMKLTLNPDGTGKMEGGPMTITPSWREADGRFCMKPMPVMPERCATLRREGAAIVGVRDGEVQFRLQRP